MKFAAFSYQGADLVGVVDAAGLNVAVPDNCWSALIVNGNEGQEYEN